MQTDVSPGDLNDLEAAFFVRVIESLDGLSPTSTAKVFWHVSRVLEEANRRAQEEHAKTLRWSTAAARFVPRP